MEESFDTPSPLRLDLRIPAGRIDVEAAQTATTRVRLDGPDDLAERATIELRGDELRVHVRDRTGFFLGFDREDYHLQVRCPEGSALRAASKSADLAAQGRLGDVRFESASGDARLDRVETLSAKTASGDVAVAESAGEVTVGTASGDVEVGRAASVVANVVSGAIRLAEVTGPVSAKSVSGDVRIDAVTAGDVSVQAVSGDVHVGVRRGSLVHVDASTLSGSTHSELELDDAPAAADASGPRVDLRLKTLNGDIAVVRALAAPAGPAV
jgi:hypothetical protein